MWATGNSLIAAKDILKAKGYKNIRRRTKRLTLKTTNKATFVAAFLYTVNKPFIEKSTAMKSEQYQGKVKQYDADTVNNEGNFKNLLPEDIICEAKLKNYLLKRFRFFFQIF